MMNVAGDVDGRSASSPPSQIHHRNTQVHYEPVSIESRPDSEEGEDALLPPSSSSSPSSYSSSFCGDDWRIFAPFWILGLLNNASYVIMLAAAKSISEGGTALVFIANVIPSLTIKLSAPYWFDKIPYVVRMKIATLCMMMSFGLVASSHRLPWQLVGVMFASAQGGLGEASLLALAGKTDAASKDHTNANQQDEQKEEKGRCLTSFSSGTGFAGVFGFFWKWFWDDWLGLSLSKTLWLAMGLAGCYWSTFLYVINFQELQHRYEQYRFQDQGEESCDTKSGTENCDDSNRETDLTLALDEFENEAEDKTVVMEISDMSFLQRFQLVLRLWPYMVPLFAVYVAEYALQSGTWTAIGFPVTDVKSRDTFFEFSNWMYQAGVFLSRSSGAIFTAPMSLLWLMPMLQIANVGIYWFIAASQGNNAIGLNFFHSPPFLYSGAFCTGLLGGAVYIHGYLRICQDLPLEHREFSLSATSVAEGLGILAADFLGLVIQACLYRINNLEGAVFTCPVAAS